MTRAIVGPGGGLVGPGGGLVSGSSAAAPPPVVSASLSQPFDLLAPAFADLVIRAGG